MRRTWGKIEPIRPRLLKTIPKKPIEKREETLETILQGKGYRFNEISKEEAMNIPAVAASVEFIASTIASMPIKLYKRTKGKIEEITKDNRLTILNADTGDLLDANQCKKAMIVDMLLDGAGYAFIKRNGNKIEGLYYIDDDKVSITINADPIYKDCKIYVTGREIREFELFRLTQCTKDGLRGVGVVEKNPLLLCAMYNAIKYENSVLSSGYKRGYLKSEYKLDADMLNQLKQGWKQLYSNDVNASPDVVVLNKGITFEPASSTATENQLNEGKVTNSDLVYSLFGLTANLFNSNSVNSDIYTNAIKTGVLPIVKLFNVALNKFMLLEREKPNMFFDIDTSEILKASVEERFQSYKTAIESGFMQIDEVRTIENMPPLGLDFVKLGLGDVLYNPKTKELFVTNTNTAFNLDDIKKSIGKEVNGDENPNPQ